MNRYFKTMREYENAHIVLWLVKDSCWVRGWHALGVGMILPTLAVALDIAWKSRRDAHDLWTNIAVCFWICANATWMTGEFFFNDSWRGYASIFFALGITSLALYYGFLRHRSQALPPTCSE